MSDDATQRAEWRIRLVRALVNREHDTETLLAMLEAGLDKAHSEGLQDAAFICQRIADSAAPARSVATAVAAAIQDLDRRNAPEQPDS